MATTVKVTVAPERIALRPGESADVEVTIQNASEVVEHFAASVVGLPSPELSTGEPDVVKLRPRESGTVRMTVAVPERGGMVAGPYTLGLLVRSPYSHEVSRCEELALDVQPVPTLTIAAQPEMVTGGKFGQYAVHLVNEGNTPLAVALSGSDPENRVGFTIQPSQLMLEPGMAGGAHVTVRSDVPLTGQEVRRAITLRAHAGEVTAEQPLVFLQRPRIRSGWIKFGGGALALAILAGATLGGALLIKDIKTNNAANSQQLPAVTQPQNPTEQPKNDQPATQQPTAAAPAPNQPAPAPTSGAPAPTTQNAPAPTTAPAPPAPTGGLNTTTAVDFTTMPNGQPFKDRPIDEDFYSDRGIKVFAVPDNAHPDCRDATQMYLRLGSTKSDSPAFNAGNFLTTTRPTLPGSCSTLPVRIEFVKAASEVNVFFTAKPGVKYTAEFKFTNGTAHAVENAGTIMGQRVAISHKDTAGRQIASVVFGHSDKNVESKEHTFLKGVGFTPAG